MSDAEELKIISAKHEWAFHELVTDQKDQEANKLISSGNNAMYQYLKQAYGSRQEVLRVLRRIILEQRERRKTLARHKR